MWQRLQSWRTLTRRMSLADPMAVMVAYLKDIPAIWSWTEGRIYEHRLPRDVWENGRKAKTGQLMPRRCVVVSQIPSSRSPDFLPVSNFQFDVKSFGTTDLEAKDVDLAVYEQLHFGERCIHGDTLILASNAVNNGLFMLDPDTDWPYVLRTYSVVMGEQYVAA